MSDLSEIQARWFRLRRSGLVEPFSSPEEAARALVGIQAQILSAAGLSLWNRTVGLSNEGLEHLLYDERSLVKLWGQRGTLHVYPSGDWPLMCSALAHRRTRWEQQTERIGGDMGIYQALVARTAEMLRQHGTMGRDDLRAADLGVDGGLFRALMGDDYREERYAAIESSFWRVPFAILIRHGLACHARPEGSRGLFAHRTYWLPDLAWDPPPAEQAHREIARRYLAAYGPASAADLAYWFGGKVAAARRWIAGLGNEVVKVRVDGRRMLALRADLDTLAETPPPREAWPARMLYRFDPLLLGLKDKRWIVDDAYYKHVWRPAGDIEGTLLEHGRITGTWRYDRRGSSLTISLSPFTPLLAAARSAVEEAAEGIARFFGQELAGLEIGDGG